MDNEKNSKFGYKLNPKYGKELNETYGDEVVEKVEKEKPKKIRTKENNFIMLKQMSDTLSKTILDKLGGEKKMGFAYLGYLQVLLNTLDYNNKVDFNIFRGLKVSESMIKVVRRKFIKLGFIKKFGNDFYVDPQVATKGQTTPTYIIELFKKG